MRSLSIYAYVDGFSTAAHVGNHYCIAIVRLDDSVDDRSALASESASALATRLLLLVNPEQVGRSIEMRSVRERDSLCHIDRSLEFKRAVAVTLRYADSRGRVHERQFRGTSAARVQHVLDVLGAYSVCADDVLTQIT